MLLTRRRKFIKRISLLTVQICLLVFFAVFIVLPVIFRYSVTLQRGILFLTFVAFPKDLDLSDPAGVGLFGTRNFYVNVEDTDEEKSLKVGVWHVLPLNLTKRFAKELQLDKEPVVYEQLQNVTETNADASVQETEALIKSEFPTVSSQNEKEFYERVLKLPGTVVLYLHGNTASRGSGHRLEIYQLLRKLGYHVLSLDYRSYGDSDPVQPTEEGVVRDALSVYQYIANSTPNQIFIWGHSLGTGVATRLCAQLNFMNEKRAPSGVVLESPFTNIRDEIRMHPFAKPFKYLPWFDMTIVRPMYMNSLRFESDQLVSTFRQPIMILHAEDDYVVPFQLGYKLYRIALDTRGKSWGPVEFHRFDGDLEYGHKYLCRAPNLPQLVKKFVDNYRNEVF